MEKYTIIIPTRDRAETLFFTLKTCLRQAYKNFEIIVCDNKSSDNTKEVVESFNDKRIKYINTGKRLSMSENFEYALSHVSDGFVMIIGSDDGIFPDTLNYVDSLVKKFNLKAISCAQATYVWPDFPDKTIAGRFVFSQLREDVEIRETDKWLRRSLDFNDMYTFELPNLYCGFVHKEIIDKAIKDGVYFRSITPDAYAAYATSIFVEKYIYSYKPFVIAGASVKSTGASQMNTKSDNDESKRFENENTISIAEGFVKCPSYQAIAGEAFSKLSKTFPDKCSGYQINYERMLYESLATSNGKTKEEIEDAVIKMAVNFSVDIDKLGKEKLYKRSASFLERLYLIISSFLKPSRVIEIEKSNDVSILNIDDAALVAHAYTINNGNTRNIITSRRFVLRKLAGFIKKIFK